MRKKTIAEATAPLTLSRPFQGWSEQNPQEWIDAARKTLIELRSKAELSSVRAIGLSGQMHGAVLLNKESDVLRPAILWNDTRAHLEARDMDNEKGWREISGNIVFPGFTAPKLHWVRGQ